MNRKVLIRPSTIEMARQFREAGELQDLAGEVFKGSRPMTPAERMQFDKLFREQSAKAKPRHPTSDEM